MSSPGISDVAKPLTLYANLGAEHIGNIATLSSAPGYYTPWIQYGVGAKPPCRGARTASSREVNGETAWATPFRHSTLSARGLARTGPRSRRMDAGGGRRGLNKGMGAPQWRAILGIAYKM